MRKKLSLQQTAEPNVCLSIDFMSDYLSTGKHFRTFNVIDNINRKALGIEIDISLPALRVVRFLEKLNQIYANPNVYEWIMVLNLLQQ